MGSQFRETLLIAYLVDKLGGDVEIRQEDIERFDRRGGGISLVSESVPSTGASRLYLHPAFMAPEKKQESRGWRRLAPPRENCATEALAQYLYTLANKEGRPWSDIVKDAPVTAAKYREFARARHEVETASRHPDTMTEGEYYQGLSEKFVLERNRAYAERNKLVAALSHQYPSSLGLHDQKPGDPPWDPEWIYVVFIDTPEGQLSWHLHESDLDSGLFDHLLMDPEKKWDGHTTEEKYRRLAALRRR